MFTMFFIALILPVMSMIAPMGIVASVATIFSNEKLINKFFMGVVGIISGYIMVISFQHYVILNTTDVVVKVISIVYPILLFLGSFLYYLVNKETKKEETE